VQPEAQSDPASSHLEDVAWVARAQSGDAAAFDSLVVKHSGKLYSLVFQMTANHDDANDLLQDVWTKVYRSLAGFRGAAKFTTWIHSIAVNMTINFLRRRNKRQAVSLDARAFPAQGTATPLGSPADETTLHPALISTQTPHSEANLSELQVRSEVDEGRGDYVDPESAVESMYSEVAPMMEPNGASNSFDGIQKAPELSAGMASNTNDAKIDRRSSVEEIVLGTHAVKRRIQPTLVRPGSHE
jgi:RNA polymerase sigma factor (sigma-70 family)